MSCFHLRRWIVNKLEQTGTSRAPAAAACKRRSLDARILAVFFFLRFSRPPHSSPPVPEPEEAPVGCCQGGQTVPFEAPLFSCSLLLLAVPPLDLLAAQYLCNPTRGGREDRCASASPSAELAQGACLNDVTARRSPAKQSTQGKFTGTKRLRMCCAQVSAAWLALMPCSHNANRRWRSSFGPRTRANRILT